MAEQKASEILLDIVTRLTEIEKMLKLNSFQQTTILKALNKLNKRFDNDNNANSIVNIKSEFEFSDSASTIPIATINSPGSNYESLIEKKNKLMSIASKTQSEENDVGYVSQEQFEKEQSKEIKNNSTGVVSKRERAVSLVANNVDKLEKMENLIPVMQKLNYDTGEPVGCASIMIRNLEDGSAEKTVSANSMGRWQAALSPGKYIARIMLLGNLISEQAFNVPVTSSIFEITAPIIYKKEIDGK